MADYETQVRNHLAEATTTLNDLEEALTQSADSGATRAPAQLGHIMKRLATDLQECEQIIEQHASDTIRVSDDLLLIVAGTMRAIHEVMSAIALVEATRRIRSE